MICSIIFGLGFRVLVFRVLGFLGLGFRVRLRGLAVAAWILHSRI